MNDYDDEMPAVGGDNLDQLIEEMETGAAALETKALGAPTARRAAPGRPGAAPQGDAIKQAVIEIGKEVISIGQKVNDMKAAQATAQARGSLPARPAARDPARAPSRMLSRQGDDPASLKGAHERKMRAWQIYQDLLARQRKEARGGRGSDPLTTASLGRLDDVLDRMSALERRLSIAEVKRDRPPGLGGRGGFLHSGGPLAPGALAGPKEMAAHYKAAVLHWMRTGQETFKGEALPDIQRRAMAMKALNTELNPDGGYVVLSERESSPLEAFLLELSMMRQRATVRTITTNELVRPVNKRGADAGWVAERGARPETESPTLAQDRFPVMELYAMPAATQTLLDDSAIDIESWLAQEVVDAMALQESPAFMTGTGGTQPRGLLSYDFVTDHSTWDHGKFRLVETGVSGGFLPLAPTGSPPTTPDSVLYDVVYSLKAGHRQNATWLLNRSTISVIRKFKDANGLPLWQPSTQMGQPAQLLGFGIDEDEYMPDIGADTVAIGFGDWKRTYLIVDRIGVRVLRDPYTQKPFILFYTTKRVGGGVQYFDAAIFLRFSV
jgi:HK97 family phage major capsid protein